MKTKKELTFSRAAAFGIGVELSLIAIQFILLAFYHSINPDTPFSFSSRYMMTQGFYIFLIPGFIVFAMVVFMMMRKYTLSVSHLFLFLIAAAVIEVAFYLSIDAAYQGAFVYSILDKVVGAALGAIGYFSVGVPEEHSSNPGHL